LSPQLAIGNDVEAGRVLQGNGLAYGAVFRLTQLGFVDSALAYALPRFSEVSRLQ
jgi:hypothetical protein